MLAYDLLNKNRQTSPILGCQILDDRLATIPCLGRLQTLIRTDSLEIIHHVQERERGGGGGGWGGGQKPYLARTLPVS